MLLTVAACQVCSIISQWRLFCSICLCNQWVVIARHVTCVIVSVCVCSLERLRWYLNMSTTRTSRYLLDYNASLLACLSTDFCQFPASIYVLVSCVEHEVSMSCQCFVGELLAASFDCTEAVVKLSLLSSRNLLLLQTYYFNFTVCWQWLGHVSSTVLKMCNSR